MEWLLVCKLEEGCLGIRPLVAVNQALIGKWIWSLADESNGVWRLVLISKYQLPSLGWRIPCSNARASGFWRGVWSCVPSFEKRIRYRAHDGNCILFWYGIWLADVSLKSRFPSFFFSD